MALFDPKAKTIAQLQKSTDEKNVSINRYFDEIGRLYYGQYRDASADVSKDINSRCDAITALYTDIEANKLKILFEKGLKLCNSCKRENPLEHAFCSTCGAKFPEGSDKQVDLPVSITVVPVIPVSSEAEDGIPSVPTQSDEEKAPDSPESVPVETMHETEEDENSEAVKSPDNQGQEF
ncbi:MAG: hypothetical protein WCG21_06700 [Eubacteriales bacterium]